jgi:hypothetical protein
LWHLDIAQKWVRMNTVYNTSIHAPGKRMTSAQYPAARECE